MSKKVIRLWKLGDIEKGIIPSKESIENLREILKKSKEEEITDIVWSDDIKLEVIEYEED